MKDRREHDDDEPASIVRSEEELRVGTERVEVGRVRARKVVDTEHVSQTVPRYVEHADVQRVAPNGVDSGQVETLPDGSISIPVFEERLVVEKRLVVTERVIIRKWSTNEDQEVQAELRRERIEIEVDPEIARPRLGDIPGTVRLTRSDERAAAHRARRRRQRASPAGRTAPSRRARTARHSPRSAMTSNHGSQPRRSCASPVGVAAGRPQRMGSRRCFSGSRSRHSALVRRQRPGPDVLERSSRRRGPPSSSSFPSTHTSSAFGFAAAASATMPQAAPVLAPEESSRPVDRVVRLITRRLPGFVLVRFVRRAPPCRSGRRPGRGRRGGGR